MPRALSGRGRKSPLDGHGWISSPERRETATSGHSLRRNIPTSVAAEPDGHGLRESDLSIECLEDIILLVERRAGEAMADTLPRKLTAILYADTAGYTNQLCTDSSRHCTWHATS